MQNEEIEESVVEESKEKVPADLMYGSVINITDGDETYTAGPNGANVPLEVTTTIVEESGVQPREADTELVELKRETRGLIEKIRDEGRAEELTKDGKKHAEETQEGATQRDQGISINATEPVMIPSKDRSLSNTTEFREEINDSDTKPVGKMGNDVASPERDGAMVTVFHSDTIVSETDETNFNLSDDKNEDNYGHLDKTKDDLEGNYEHLYSANFSAYMCC